MHRRAAICRANFQVFLPLSNQMQVSLAAAAPVEDLDDLDDLAVESSLLLAPPRPRTPTPARVADRASSTDFWCRHDEDWRHEDDADEGLLLPLT